MKGDKNELAKIIRSPILIVEIESFANRILERADHQFVHLMQENEEEHGNDEPVILRMILCILASLKE
jgi:hypothetical protein